MKKNIFSKGKLVGLLFIFVLVVLPKLHAQSPDNCSTFPTWDAATAYNANDNVKQNNIHYKANWWTQGDDPSTNSGPTGSGKAWTVVGTCGTVTNPPVGTYWDLNGNSNATSSSYIGTSNYIPLMLKSNNIVGLRVNPSGSVNIGEVAQDTWYYKFEVSGLTALTGPSSTNQTNLLSIYSGNTTTSSYAQGYRHYIGFSHGLFGSEEFGIINAYDYNRTLGTGKGKHMLIQNTAEGNLGIGVFTTAPDAKLSVNGLSKFTSSATLGGDAARFVHPTKTSTGRDHYVFIANRPFEGNTSVMHGVIGAYENTPGSTTAEGPKDLIVQGQSIGGNLGIGYHPIAPVAKLSVNGTTFLNGTVGIGDSYVPTGFKLSVNGKIIATEVQVKLRTKWPDYVFKPTFNLISLDSVAAYINVNHHLPDVPSEQEIQNNGVPLGEMDAILLKKVEELTLYSIEQQNQIKEQKEYMEVQNRLIEELLKRLEKLEKGN